MEQKPRQAKFIQMRTRMDYRTLGTIVLWISRSMLDHDLNYKIRRLD